MSQPKNSENFEFKAEVNKLLNIITHSLYTNREIFLRELVSNASDALDKLRFLVSKGEEVADPDLPLEITISLDKDKKLLTVSDTGVGMSHDELVANLGTIAKSGSEEFLSKLAEEKKRCGQHHRPVRRGVLFRVHGVRGGDGDLPFRGQGRAGLRLAFRRHGRLLRGAPGRGIQTGDPH